VRQQLLFAARSDSARRHGWPAAELAGKLSITILRIGVGKVPKSVNCIIRASIWGRLGGTEIEGFNALPASVCIDRGKFNKIIPPPIDSQRRHRSNTELSAGLGDPFPARVM
jgi:hypothetical protein